MTRKVFMETLERMLSDVSFNDRYDALSYYKEYFDYLCEFNTEPAKTLNAACPISDGQAEFGVFFDGGQKHA